MNPVASAPRSDIRDAYSRMAVCKTMAILVICAGLGLLILVAAASGSANLRVEDVAKIITSRLLPSLQWEVSVRDTAIIWDIRLPRVAMGILAGAGLAVSGATMQGILRNPLVSPFTIGISAAASFGASVAIILGAGMIGMQQYMIITNAFAFSLAAAFLVYVLAGSRGMRPESLVLAGIAINYFFSAGTSLLQYVAGEEEVRAVVHWLFGSLTGVTWGNALVVAVVLAICIPWLIRHAWDLNALAGGDDLAMTLGINPRRIRTVCMILSVLMTASVICFTGIIGFVCLVSPHIARMIIGADHRFLLPCSGLLGAIMLLGADTLGRAAFQPSVIPVGIVVSLIGVPFFIYLVMKTRREYFQ